MEEKMNQISTNPYFLRDTIKQHEELIDQLRMEKLVRESNMKEKPRKHWMYNALALTGRRLVGLGANLEKRFSIEPESTAAMSQQDNPGGCL
jgi:hypothetical protein